MSELLNKENLEMDAVACGWSEEKKHDVGQIRWLWDTLVQIRDLADAVLETGGITFWHGEMKKDLNGKLDEKQIDKLLSIVDYCNMHLHG